MTSWHIVSASCFRVDTNCVILEFYVPITFNDVELKKIAYCTLVFSVYLSLSLFVKIILYLYLTYIIK